MRSLRSPLLVLAFAGAVVAAPAYAQQAESYPPPCDASKVSKSDVERAHTVFLSGKQYLDESNYDKAISYFNDAYSIDCSVHAILPIIATAYERKGDKGGAVRALEEYLKRAPNAPDREHIERRIKNLNDQLAQATPTVAPTASAAVGAPTPAPAAAPQPGVVAPSSAPAPAPAPSSPDESHRSSSVGPLILAGAGAAVAIGGAVVLGVGAGKISSATSECNGGRANCPPDVATKGNSGRTLETVGVAVLIPGAVALGAGVIWLIVQKATAVPSAGAYVSPVVAPGYAGVTVGSTL
jgi:tetratricopeptide (TPR) repeat protein